MTTVAPQGLHHVTAIAGNPQRNVDFYTKVLGLRLVKQTVNFDAPDTYHLYYGDEAGRPASLLTFFPWDGVPGGVLFEIATDTPGFDIDEPLLELGKSLKLPPWLEPNRDQIRAALPVLTVDDPVRRTIYPASAALQGAVPVTSRVPSDIPDVP